MLKKMHPAGCAVADRPASAERPSQPRRGPRRQRAGRPRNGRKSRLYRGCIAAVSPGVAAVIRPQSCRRSISYGTGVIYLQKSASTQSRGHSSEEPTRAAAGPPPRRLNHFCFFTDLKRVTSTDSAGGDLPAETARRSNISSLWPLQLRC